MSLNIPMVDHNFKFIDLPFMLGSLKVCIGKKFIYQVQEKLVTDSSILISDRLNM